MELPCVTHWAEPTTPNRGAEPGRNQRAKIYRENILLRADFLSYPVHCTFIWPLLALTGVAAAPQKPQCSSSPAVWDTRQKGSSGKVLAHGHTPSMLSACQEQTGELREAGRWLSTLQVQCKPQHSQQPNLWHSGAASRLILQRAQQLSPLAKLQGLCGSAPHHRGFYRLTTCKIQLIGQSR